MPWSDAGVVDHLVDEAEWERRRYSTCRQVEVSEHRAERKRCPCCGTLNGRSFLKRSAEVQYGPRLPAYLKNYVLDELFEAVRHELCGQPTIRSG